MIQFSKDRYSHMPFIQFNSESQPMLFCCLQINGIWKIHYYNGTRWVRLYTGLPDDATQCSPAAEYEDGMWKISFIAGGSEESPMFYLYRKYGFEAQLAIPVMPADVGFIWKEQTTIASRKSSIFQFEQGATTQIQLQNIEYLYRITYNPNNPRQLLISGQEHSGNIFSITYFPQSGQMFRVFDGDKICYKACFWYDECYYAQKKDDEGFEDRRIVKAENLILQPIEAQIYIKNIKIEQTDYFQGELD